jgi:rhodanese-related sulfurtransferase
MNERLNRRKMGISHSVCMAGMVWALATSSLAQSTASMVSLEVARQALDTSTAWVIDIREPSEHATGVAKGAKLIPMSQLNQRISEIPKANSQPVLLICNTQNRSSKVVEQLRGAGYGHVSYVNQGMSQWAARGWPMVKPGAN